MLRITTLFIVLLLSNSLAFSNQAPSTVLVPQGATLLKLEAGTKNKRGRFNAQSSNERFSVQFPNVYHEWLTVIEGLASPATSLGSIALTGTKYVITEIPMVDEIESQHMRKVVDNLFNTQPILHSKNITHKGIKGKDIKIKSQTTSTIYRFLFTEHFTYQLSVEYSNQYRTKPLREAKKFFRSFALHRQHRD